MNKAQLLRAMERRLEDPKAVRLTAATKKAAKKTAIQSALKKIQGP